MGGTRAFFAGGLVALAVAVPAAAECPASSIFYAPAFVGPLKTYGVETLLVDPVDGGKSTTAKTSKQCVDCEVPTRGVQLVAQVRRCAKCGAFPDGTDQYCIFCGETLSPPAPPQLTSA